MVQKGNLQGKESGARAQFRKARLAGGLAGNKTTRRKRPGRPARHLQTVGPAAPLIVKIGQVAERMRHVRMFAAQRLLQAGDGVPVLVLGFGITPHRHVAVRQIVAHDGHFQVLRPEKLLTEGQGALEQGPRFAMPVQPGEQNAQLVELHRYERMFRSISLFEAGQRLPVQLFRFSITPLRPVQRRQKADLGQRHLRVTGPQ
ncbi:MAG: hypothetical protein BWY57_02605 [Betaproteobacteria bacterium ADurb.Bin341]|nr:MAG: hypothetical protein BWY57_02605 [Betaproteobacteria bacterium ADurb.Bin341]